MAATSTNTAITLKLLVDTNSKKVLFAEAGKDFIDFLFGLLQLPVGAVLALLRESDMASSWSLGRLYESIQSLDTDYLQPKLTKHSPLLNEVAHVMNQPCGYYNSKGGYVRGAVTYMVMDDLSVTPMSTISNITLLNTLNTFRVKEIGSLEEKIVQVDKEKGLELFQTSFVSTTILTDLFMQQTSSASITTENSNSMLDAE